jgi:hypothetical protein
LPRIAPVTALAASHGELLKLHKPNVTPHCQNLLHQCTSKSAANVKSAAKAAAALGQIVPAYVSLVKTIETFSAATIRKSAAAATEAFDEYMTLLRLPENDLFSSVSDLKTSAVPDFFLRLFDALLEHHKAAFLEVSGQRDIPVELSFDTRTADLVFARTQRVDVAIVMKASLTVQGQELNNFAIPVFAAEAKTYFDKNMLSGVDQSAAGMKRTFPHCLYLAIAEFADFELGAQSYASGSMDEIFVLRHQKRADFRKTGVAHPIDTDLVAEILQTVERAIIDYDEPRPNLEERLKTGKLIG